MSQQERTVQNSSHYAAGLAAKFHGILVPFPTTCDGKGDLNAPALRSNIGRWRSKGVAGFVALGSTGERVHLDERERALVVESSRSAVPETSVFVVGVGAHSTRLTVTEAADAVRAGADALLVITPHFYRGAMTQEALYEHFVAVADGSPRPIILYNIPQNTGVVVAPETVARLSEHENIVGIKDSSGDFVNFMEMIRVAGRREDFALMTGHAATLYASLGAGARGGILAAACVVPELCVGVYEAFAAGEYARARALQERLLPVARAVTTRYGIGGLKYAMDLRGYAGGEVRAPLPMPHEEARAEIARLLEEALGEGSDVARSGM